MLYQWIVTAILVMMAALSPLRGRWAAFFGRGAGFFHFLALMFLPGLVLAAPIVFILEGLLAARIASRKLRVPIVLGTVALYCVLSGVMGGVAQVGWRFVRAEEALVAPIFVILPISALGVFCFWLPATSSGLYVLLAKKPRWWVTALIGCGTLFLGIVLWLLLGTLAGAQTD